MVLTWLNFSWGKAIAWPECTGALRPPNFSRIEHFVDRIELVQGDLLDQNSLADIVKRIAPDEIYNLAAQSFVPVSWNSRS
jgi:GDP-D-mannose dehydratase